MSPLRYKQRNEVAIFLLQNKEYNYIKLGVCAAGAFEAASARASVSCVCAGASTDAASNMRLTSIKLPLALLVLLCVLFDMPLCALSGSAGDGFDALSRLRGDGESSAPMAIRSQCIGDGLPCVFCTCALVCAATTAPLTSVVDAAAAPCARRLPLPPRLPDADDTSMG